MSKVWAAKGRDAGFGSESKRSAAREAKYRYQKKEMELEEARTALSRVRAELEQQKTELTRNRRDMDRKRLEMMRLDERERDLHRAIQDLEAKASEQKTTVAKLEHEVEQLREEAFRGRNFGV